MANGCVYIALNTVNGAFYIGKSVMGLAARRLTHHSAARNGKMQPFTCALRKYGFDAFEWAEWFLSDDDASLRLAEREAISCYQALNLRLYNLTGGGDGGVGRPLTEAMKGALHGPQARRKAAKSIKDSWTPERKAAQAEVLRARLSTPEHRAAVSKGMTGLRRSEATKEAIRQAKLGKRLPGWSPERRAKMEATWARKKARKLLSS